MIEGLQSFVFTGVYNFSGWDSTAIAWLIGLLNSSFAFVGFDLRVFRLLVFLLIHEVDQVSCLSVQGLPHQRRDSRRAEKRT